jgi:hypothetical protein
MKNFLQHLSVGDETLAGCNQALQNDLCFSLMRMSGSNQVHGDIRINEDQP